MLKGKKKGSAKRKMIVNLAKPIHGQRVEDTARSARKNVEPEGSRQRERKRCPHRFYYNLVFCGYEMVECAKLMKINLTTQERLSHKALKWKVSELRKQERRYREGLTMNNEKLERTVNEMEAGEKKFVKFYGVECGCETSEVPKRGTAERDSSNGSRGSPELSGSPEVRSPT